MEQKESAVPVHDIAVSIYVELAARNVQVTEGAVKMTASAANLAALSLKLAEAFVKAEEDAAAAKAPDTKYKLEGADIAAWTTK
jgi:hypothetical protein